MNLVESLYLIVLYIVALAHDKFVIAYDGNSPSGSVFTFIYFVENFTEVAILSFSLVISSNFLKIIVSPLVYQLLYCQKENQNNHATTNSKLLTLKIFFNYL